MQTADFTEDSAGEVKRSPVGHLYFVPGELPPKLNITWELTDQIVDAQRYVAELNGLARNLPNPNLLIAPFTRREAVLSSRIEGTQASLSDLLFFEAAPTPAGEATDVSEVRNYVLALQYGLSRLADLPLSLRLIREIHQRLMEGVRGDHARPGEFRRSQNWIGPAGSTIDEATYVPPAPREMTGRLAQFERYLHSQDGYPTMIELALIHYQFEAIHPFLDGNGRVGRLLIPLLLCERRLLNDPLLYLSAFFERHRDEYYRRLREVSTHGRWAEWLRFFLTGVKEQSLDAMWRTDQLLAHWNHCRAAMESTRSSARLLTLVDRLFVSPVIIATTDLANELGVSLPTALTDVRKLVDAGILKEITGRRRYRVYVAQEIIDIAERERPVDDD